MLIASPVKLAVLFEIGVILLDVPASAVELHAQGHAARSAEVARHPEPQHQRVAVDHGAVSFDLDDQLGADLTGL
jgi:hypothetical protein